MKVKHKTITGGPSNVDEFLNEMMKEAKRPINELVLGITYDSEFHWYEVFYLSEE